MKLTKINVFLRKENIYCGEKFRIVSDNHGLTQKCDFSVLGRKYAFWVNLAQKIKVVSLS